MNKSKVDLDLDAIKGKGKTVRLRGEIIEINPITVDDLFELQMLIASYEETKTLEVAPDDALAFLKDFKSQIEEIIPGLKGVRCSLEDLMAIVELAFSTAIPKDQEELAKRKITPKDHQKKAAGTIRS